MIEEEVISIIAKYQGIDSKDINVDSNLIRDIGLSSFDVMGLVCKFEDQFNIEIPDREITKVRTIRDIINKIKEIKNI